MMQKFCFRFIAAMVVISCCSCNDSNSDTAETRWESAESWIERQLEMPRNLDLRFNYVDEHYVPRLRLAWNRLPAMKRREVPTFAGPAYVRPLLNDGWVFWVVWVRADNTSRVAELSDAQGQLARFEVPLPEVHPNLIQFEVVGLFVAPPPEQRGNKVKLERPLDPKTLRLRIYDPSRPGLPENETVRVGELPMAGLLVLDIGNANQITEWALTQEDPNRIFGAMEALMEIAAGLRSEQEAVEAKDGYLRIHQKLLSGWPDADLPDAGAGNSLLYYSRDTAHGTAQSDADNQPVQELWQRINELDSNSIGQKAD